MSRTLNRSQGKFEAMPDYHLEDVTLWTAYRRDLRGITDQPGFPENINWPNAPT
jgi:hypothetical protein